MVYHSIVVKLPSATRPSELSRSARTRLMLKFAPFIAAALLFSSLSRADIDIVTTIKPLQLIAAAIVQDSGSVSSILDPEQSPHHFTMSPSDRVALAQADMTIWIGPLFETFLSDFFAQTNVRSKTITVLDLAELQLHALDPEHPDAHLWLDSRNAQYIATAIMRRAVELDPDNAEAYRENLQSFSMQIEANTSRISKKFQTPSAKSYAVYHNAYQYFEKQFGIEHDVVILRDPESQPSIRQIVELRSSIKQHQPSCLLLEFDSSEELVNTVLDGHELKLMSIDLLGSNVDVDENGFSNFMSNLADDFYSCLYH